MQIILASGSPRRKELLKMVIPEFDIIISGAEEILDEGITPEEQVSRIAYLKAKSVFDETKGDRIVIGSDTMVVKNSKIFGKPKSEKQAKEMIKELLQGDRTHHIITGLSIIIQKYGKNEEYKTFDKVKVYFKDMADVEIERWIATGKAMDKAGGYAIQEEFAVFVEKIEGNYSTAVGLPIHKVYDIIKKYI